MMTQTELVNKYAEFTHRTKGESKEILKEFAEFVKYMLVNGEEFQLRGYFTMDITERAAWNGMVPNTSERRMYDAVKIPHCTFGKYIKDAINSKE